MGTKPDDLAGEIRDLRDETAVIVDELASRATPGYVAHELRTTVSERVSETAHTARDTADTARMRVASVASDVSGSMPEPVRRNPSVVGGATLGLLASLGAFTVANTLRRREHTPPERAGRALSKTADRLDERFRVLYAPAAAGLAMLAQQWATLRQSRLMMERSEPSMFKRVVWVGMVSMMGTLGAILFQRLSASMWRRTMHEDPPKK